MTCFYDDRGTSVAWHQMVRRNFPTVGDSACAFWKEDVEQPYEYLILTRRRMGNCESMGAGDGSSGRYSFILVSKPHLRIHPLLEAVGFNLGPDVQSSGHKKRRRCSRCLSLVTKGASSSRRGLGTGLLGSSGFTLCLVVQMPYLEGKFHPIPIQEILCRTCYDTSEIPWALPSSWLINTRLLGRKWQCR